MTYSEAMAARVLELEAALRDARADARKQRARAELWRTRCSRIEAEKEALRRPGYARAYRERRAA